MIIQRPITATRDQNNRYRTFLHFERGEKIPFYIRGSISWPELNRQGFVILAGQQIETGIIYIFEQQWFWTVPIWINPDGSLKQDDEGKFQLGLIQHIKDWDALYKNATYFHGSQEPATVRRYSLELYRNELTPKNISLIEVPYVTEIGDGLIDQKTMMKKFTLTFESPLHRSLEQWESLRSVEVGDNGAVHALRALFAGYEAQPFVRMGES